MAYYKQDISPFTLSLWWQACAGYDLEQVSKALSAHAVDPEAGRYPPKVADVVRQLSGTTTDRAEAAWSKTMRAISGVGPWRDVVFDDPAIHAVIDALGGWPKICATTVDDLSYLQHRFVTSYKALSKDVPEYSRVLRGLRSPDEIYAQKGLAPPKPEIVGDIDKARQVYLQGVKEWKPLTLTMQ
jgi:hypothetical protein